jgi:hypothetical protein
MLWPAGWRLLKLLLAAVRRRIEQGARIAVARCRERRPSRCGILDSCGDAALGLVGRVIGEGLPRLR